MPLKYFIVYEGENPKQGKLKGRMKSKSQSDGIKKKGKKDY